MTTYRELKIDNTKVKVYEEEVGKTISRTVKVGWGFGNKVAFFFASIMAIIGWFSLFSSLIFAIILIVVSMLWMWGLGEVIRKESQNLQKKPHNILIKNGG
jgi:hypothetical protein